MDMSVVPLLFSLISLTFLWPGSVSGLTQQYSVVLGAHPGLVLLQGESLNLTCLITVIEPFLPAPVLAYSMERQSLTVSTGSQTLLIDKVTKSHSGRYRCSVTDHTGARIYSREVLVTVEERVVRPTLTVEPPGGRVFSEDAATLTCQLPGHPGWALYWYKDRQETAPVQQAWGSAGRESKGVYRLWQATLPHTGQYWCRGGRGKPVFYTQYSEAVYVNVTERITNVTIVASPSRVVKKGRALNLTCEAVINNHPLSLSDHNWAAVVLKFSFLQNSWPVVQESDSRVYSIARAQHCHAGSYRCVVRAGRARRSSPEIFISLDDLTLKLVVCFGTLFIISVAPLAFLLRHYGPRLWSLRNRRQEEIQCRDLSTIQQP